MLLLLLLLRSKASPLEIRQGFSKNILAIRGKASERAASTLGLAQPAVSKVGIQQITKNLSVSIEAAKASSSKLSEVAILIKPQLDRIGTTEVFKTTHETILKNADRDQKVKWIARLDKRTCSVCEGRNNQIYSIKDCPDIDHPRCRCYIISI